jgi:hypothetical protein
MVIQRYAAAAFPIFLARERRAHMPEIAIPISISIFEAR